MDGGAWWAIVHRVEKSWTQLSDFTFTFHCDALEKEMATHSSILAWRIPGTEEPGGLPSIGSHRVGHDWCELAAAAAKFVICVDFLYINKIYRERCTYMYETHRRERKTYFQLLTTPTLSGTWVQGWSNSHRLFCVTWFIPCALWIHNKSRNKWSATTFQMEKAL